MDVEYSPVSTSTSPSQRKEPMARCSVTRTEGGGLSNLVSSITRKKVIEDKPSQLARVLSLFDLTFIGVGTTLGVGVYVLAGQVARDQSGPAVVLSFAIAAVASLLAGFCYAEFAARVPRAGSVYVYAYVTIGELTAFVIGWDLVLEYAIGTATVARAVTGYVDNLVNNATSEFFRTYMPMNIEHMAPYPDFIAFTFVMLLSVLLAIGVKESSYLNSFLTGLNLLTIVTVVVAGSLYANPSNWDISMQNITWDHSQVGTGGFAPFGLQGIIRGAATSFFGYVGFDIIATTSEEAKNPRRNIPLAIMISLFIVFVTYFSMATVLTMMVPYYTLDLKAPYPTAFNDLGMYSVKWIVTIGGILALNTSLIGGMFPLPRILYAMSQDGLLFHCLGRVNSCTKTPVIATMVSGLLSAVMVLFFDLRQLVDMMSIGTLLAYSLVALCVMVLRFTESEDNLPKWRPTSGCIDYLRGFVNADRCREPTRASGTVSLLLIAAFCAVSLALCGVMAWSSERFYDGDVPEVASAIFLASVLVVLLILLSFQPQSKADKLNFAVPCMPVIPCLSILLNIYLMTELSIETWARFIVWLIIAADRLQPIRSLSYCLSAALHFIRETVGYSFSDVWYRSWVCPRHVLGAIVYFSYSIRNSAEKNRDSATVSVTTAEMLAVNKEDLRL